jgi:hypothetical protein
MVSADGDGIVRKIKYGVFREDKEAEPGFTREIYNAEVDPKYYDNLAGLPLFEGKDFDIISLLRRQVKDRGDKPFLGTRDKAADGTLLPSYSW